MRIFEHGITIKVQFSHNLTEKEQNTFWEKFITLIERFGFSFGGGHNEGSLEGYIDLSKASKTERINFLRNIDDFVLSKTDVVCDYKIKKKIYLKRIIN
ncbi:MAG TPA: 50S ribosome-binding protein YggL [Prolixibacteraceae bacterium]|nr:50S ribosome-binding protein YggL [Prolixibacteraceae bacterium]